MRFAEMTDWGTALPPSVLSNAHLATLDTDDGWTDQTVWALIEPNLHHYGKLEQA